MNIDYAMSNGRSKALVLLGVLLLGMGIVSAAEATQVAQAIGCMICRIMQVLYMIIGAVAVLIIIFAGLKWMGSGEDPDARNQAKQMIIHALIGIIIIIVAAFLVSWLIGGTNMLPSGVLDPTSAISGCDTWCSVTTT